MRVRGEGEGESEGEGEGEDFLLELSCRVVSCRVLFGQKRRVIETYCSATHGLVKSKYYIYRKDQSKTRTNPKIRQDENMH